MSVASLAGYIGANLLDLKVITATPLTTGEQLILENISVPEGTYNFEVHLDFLAGDATTKVDTINVVFYDNADFNDSIESLFVGTTLPQIHVYSIVNFTASFGANGGNNIPLYITPIFSGNTQPFQLFGAVIRYWKL